MIDTSYILGRNTGNTFQQMYGNSMVQGVPIKGPLVGTKFPLEDYIAIPIGHHELYVSWLDPTNFAIVDVFVMDFAHHIVFDYAPGSAHPESAGTVTIVHRGQGRYPDRLWPSGRTCLAIRWVITVPAEGKEQERDHARRQMISHD